MAKPSDKAGDTNPAQSEKNLLSFQVVMDFLVRNGGASEARALEEEVVTVQEEEKENDSKDSNVCLAFLLDLSTFHRKDFTLLKSS